ncbi:hypothetical protein E2562_004758 [Oryza meyeriana var. granulata]|uniref:Uncharacterized protein n=1 Tax=Oryza meyeriana var. granulata TaxID=110450 RepID=A0A6G1DDA3_9ORYZ|nr:hypothetical protein E2562_004758 [Oryza meyeriana var. granulata]
MRPRPPRRASTGAARPLRGQPPPTSERIGAQGDENPLLTGKATAPREGDGPVVGIEVPAAEVVLVRRASAVRRYPPGCGRGAAVSNAGAPAGEGRAEPSKEQSALCNGEAKAIAGDQKVVVDADFNGWMNCGGDTGGAEEEGGGRPWDLTGLMVLPFLPWAQHGRRSQRQKPLHTYINKLTTFC